MKAGRELDALVAEKVMGLKREARMHGSTDMIKIYTDNPYFFDVVRKQDLHHVAPRPYSSEIAAAWEVVEKISRDTDEFHISCVPRFLHKFQVTIWPEGSHRCEAQADTAPLAICLAALKAVGVSKVETTTKNTSPSAYEAQGMYPKSGMGNGMGEKTEENASR